MMFPRRAARRRLAQPLVLALLAALALATVVSGVPSPISVEAKAAGSIDREDRGAFIRRLAEMIDAVEARHVADEAEDVDGTELVHGAIRGLLDTLDPHSHFLDSEAYRTMRESQDGSFYGLGIIISVRRDDEGKNRLTVISPIDGMPAKRLGVRSGDIIAAIEGESTDGMSLDQAVSRLRGEKNTTVNVTIERADESFDLDIERDEIPTESVPHAFMIRDDVGFIRVKDFTKTTTVELQDALARLRSQGMERLILDLRDNPGGLLDEAVSVSSLFLDPADTVVETRGRVRGANETHLATSRVERTAGSMPLIVLVNRGSASASEIVAGAVQDHDRGLVVGTTTWGKGLVQSVYNLSSDCGLALTTARYYTPSGRQIQRDYRSSYFDYYFPRDDEAPSGERHVTEGGREVRSGGGIAPDVRVEAHEEHDLVRDLRRRSAFFRFANHEWEPVDESAAGVGFGPNAEDLRAFRAFLAEDGLDLSEEDWQDALGDVERQLAYEIVSAWGDMKEAFRVQCENDPQVLHALELWPHATRGQILADARSGKTPVVEAPDEIEEEPARRVASHASGGDDGGSDERRAEIGDDGR